MNLCPKQKNGQVAKNKGNWDMLTSVGKFLGCGAWLIRGIAFDGHLANTFLREALRGHFKSLAQSDLATLAFWRDVTFDDFPAHNLPRLPVKICLYEGEPLWAIAGPCHASKNMGGQVVSPLRTIMMGKFFVDTSHMLTLGLPPSAYCRSCAMCFEYVPIRRQTALAVPDERCSSRHKQVKTFSKLP